MLTGIDTIIFDLGGVILDISPAETEARFEKLGIAVTRELFHVTPDMNPFTMLEKGEIDEDSFYHGVRKTYEKDLTDEQIRHAWDGMLLGWTPERIDLIRHLRKHYRILLLSNTNRVHYETYTNSFRQQFGFPFEELFDELYVSHEMGCRKPHRDIYEKLIAQSGITPDRAIFIDDTLVNVEAAQQSGIRAYHLTGGEDIRDILSH